MKVLACLRCRRHSLIATGAFWACAMCGYAITQAALLVEAGRQAPEPSEAGHWRGGRA